MEDTTPDRPIAHGTYNGYCNRGCRCDPCRAAKAAYSKIQRERYAKKIAADKRAYYLANRERIDAYNRAWVKANPERDRARRKVRRSRPEVKARKAEYHRAWYEANRERRLIQTKAWCEANPERRKAIEKAYRDANPDRMRESSRKWSASHPEAVVANSARRRTRKREGDVRKVTDRDWARLCARYDHRCAYCGERRKLTQDHVIPIVRGGRHAIGNLLPACRSCNSKKRTRLLIEWRVVLLRESLCLAA